MSYHKVEASSCYSIFTKAESQATEASESHTSVSGDIDTLGSACTGKSATLASSLNAVYNRVLTAAMTGSEQQINNAVAGGRSAVSAIVHAHDDMATTTANAERRAYHVDEVQITDGKNA